MIELQKQEEKKTIAREESALIRMISESLMWETLWCPHKRLYI